MKFGCEEFLIPDNPDPTFFSTGSDRIDKLLGGGILAGELTEVFGYQGVGKTQFALALCGHASKVCNVLIIDTEGAVQHERLRELKVREDAVCVVRMSNADRVLACLPHVLPRLLKDIGNVGLVILDSVVSLSKATTMTRPIQHIVAFASRLGYVANTHGCAILLVNKEKEPWKIEGPAPTAGEETEDGPIAAMGEQWGEVCSTRLALERDRAGIRKATLVKSERVRLGSTEFAIGEAGICDVD